MAATREQLVKLVRAAMERHPQEVDVPPATYDPPDWLLEAMQRAYEQGQRNKPRAAEPYTPTDVLSLSDHGAVLRFIDYLESDEQLPDPIDSDAPKGSA